MTEKDCETIRQAAMAQFDGETPPLSVHLVQSHLAECAKCREEVDDLHLLSRQLEAQPRCQHVVDLWPGIEHRLATETVRAGSVRSAVMSLVLVLTLLVVRATLLTTVEARDWILRCFALFFVLGWFAVLRENPFAIYPHSIETKETRP